MATVVYQLNAEEISNNLLQSIKTFFAGRRVTLTVTADEKEITSPDLLAKVEASEGANHAYLFSSEEFAAIVRDFSEDPDMNLTPVFETYKVGR